MAVRNLVIIPYEARNFNGLVLGNIFDCIDNSVFRYYFLAVRGYDKVGIKVNIGKLYGKRKAAAVFNLGRIIGKRINCISLVLGQIYGISIYRHIADFDNEIFRYIVNSVFAVAKRYTHIVCPDYNVGLRISRIYLHGKGVAFAVINNRASAFGYNGKVFGFGQGYVKTAFNLTRKIVKVFCSRRRVTALVIHTVTERSDRKGVFTVGGEMSAEITAQRIRYGKGFGESIAHLVIMVEVNLIARCVFNSRPSADGVGNAYAVNNSIVPVNLPRRVELGRALKGHTQIFFAVVCRRSVTGSGIACINNRVCTPLDIGVFTRCINRTRGRINGKLRVAAAYIYVAVS